MIPGRVGFPLGVVLALVGGVVPHPVLSLLAMVIVVDAAAMLTTVRAALATMVVCLCMLGTSAFVHDGFVLLLNGLSALGFGGLIRFAAEADIPNIPLRRRGDSLG